MPLGPVEEEGDYENKILCHQYTWQTSTLLIVFKRGLVMVFHDDGTYEAHVLPGTPDAFRVKIQNFLDKVDDPGLPMKNTLKEAKFGDTFTF